MASAVLFCMALSAQEVGHSEVGAYSIGEEGLYSEGLPIGELPNEGLSAANIEEQTMELRARATVTKDLPRGFALSLRQDFRARMVDRTYTTEGNTSEPPSIRRLYTTLSLHYEPIEYVHLRAAYMLRILGDKWEQQPKDYIQHRAMVDITGQYRYRQWKFALMEQLDIDCRMDKPDERVARTASLLLRHCVKADYSFAGTPLQLKSKVELHNTLNQPTAYLDKIDPVRHYGQYLTSARAEIGLRWKINDRHSLTLTYRYQWDYKRSVSITPIVLPDTGTAAIPAAFSSTEGVSLTYTRTHSHIIQLAYELALPK